MKVQDSSSIQIIFVVSHNFKTTKKEKVLENHTIAVFKSRATAKNMNDEAIHYLIRDFKGSLINLFI